jgi:hypothetical protein
MENKSRNICIANTFTSSDFSFELSHFLFISYHLQSDIHELGFQHVTKQIPSMLPLEKRQKVGKNTEEEKVEVMSTSVTTKH